MSVDGYGDHWAMLIWLMSPVGVSENRGHPEICCFIIIFPTKKTINWRYIPFFWPIIPLGRLVAKARCSWIRTEISRSLGATGPKPVCHMIFAGLRGAHIFAQEIIPHQTFGASNSLSPFFQLQFLIHFFHPVLFPPFLFRDQDLTNEDMGWKSYIYTATQAPCSVSADVLSQFLVRPEDRDWVAKNCNITQTIAQPSVADVSDLRLGFMKFMDFA